MEITSILLLVNILMNIIICILFIGLIKNTGNKNKKIKKVEFNKDEYLNSLEFNKKLDWLIVPLLDKNDNETIVEKVIKKLITSDPNINNISNNELQEYITNVLSNYNNNFVKSSDLEEELDTSTIVYQDPAREFSQELNNEINISSTLNNFYND